jgi:hypothetical protein
LIEKIKEINLKIDETNALLKIVRPDIKLDINELFEVMILNIIIL